MPSPPRRNFLQFASVSAIGLLAGCSSTNSMGEPTETTKTGELAEPTAASTDGCPKGYERIGPDWEAEGPGPRLGFELKLEEETIERGDRLVAKVTNVTSEQQTTGVKGMFDIQYRDGETWETILGMEGDWMYQATGKAHQPGSGFVYDFPFTEEGLTNPADHDPPIAVCSPLEPGEYRFSYFGLTREDPQDGPEPGIVQPFTVRRATT